MSKKKCLTCWVMVSVLLFGVFSVSAQDVDVTPEPSPTMDAPELAQPVELLLVEVGDIETLVNNLRAELTPLLIMALFSAIGTAIYIVVELLRQWRKKNEKLVSLFFDGIEVTVKPTKGLEFIRRLVEAEKSSTIEEIRAELMDKTKRG